MTRSQALTALEAVGTEEALRLAQGVKYGPDVLSPVVAQEVERLIASAHIRTAYGP